MSKKVASELVKIAKELTSGFSFTVERLYVMLTPKKASKNAVFNVDTIHALNNIFVKFKSDEGDNRDGGSVRLVDHRSAGIVTRIEEKQGLVKQSILTFHIPKGSYAEAMKKLEKVLGGFGFSIEKVQTWTEPKIVKCASDKTAFGARTRRFLKTIDGHKIFEVRGRSGPDGTAPFWFEIEYPDGQEFAVHVSDSGRLDYERETPPRVMRFVDAHSVHFLPTLVHASVKKASLLEYEEGEDCLVEGVITKVGTSLVSVKVGVRGRETEIVVPIHRIYPAK